MIDNTTRPNIITLPPQVADRIAAGEVVERPAAVLKELIENSIDAGATDITIVIEDAGRTLIKVIDNGIGLTDSEMVNSIGRHATSKLNQFEDLESLITFGFRGEALPSIAAVSRLDIVSRTRDSEVGSLLRIAGGRIENQSPTAAPIGTSISVGHLFYNVPARRKFLKSDTTEFRWISTTFRYFALAFPDVSWKFFRKKDLIHELPRTENHRERIAGLFGDDVAEELIEVNHESNWLKVTGWISPPSLAQRTKADQYLFMNRRPIVHSRMQWRISDACRQYYTSGGHPLYLVFLEASPEQFDINVHPAKKEIKFADENGAVNTAWNAVRRGFDDYRHPEGLTASSSKKPSPQPDRRFMSRSFSQSTESQSSQPMFSGTRSREPEFNPVPIRHGASRAVTMPFPPDKQVSHDKAAATFNPESFEAPAADAETGEPRVWQVFDMFIISPLKTGVVFIDQHIAHERILYEKALNAINSKPWNSQRLLFPTTFKVTENDSQLVEEAVPMLKSMGFDLESVGPREYRILAVPTGVKISNERDMLLGIIEEMHENNTAAKDPRHILAAAFACRGAVKAGQPLKDEEMRRLIDELFRTEDPEFCPHGRPIYQVLNRREIEKWFDR